jgi:hypothetical protein
MRKVLAVFVISLLAMVSMGVASADIDPSGVVLGEQAQAAIEKAEIEAEQGNGAEAQAYDDIANSNFGKTELGFHRISGAVITASYTWAGKIRTHK